VRLFAPAKVNLTLRVTGQRADGYHLLDSLVVFAGVGDTLLFAPADTLTLTTRGPFAESLAGETDNIILRAARALQAASETRLGAQITLTKTLPVSSGIGGGSADAAATLHGLNRLWDAGLSAGELAALGLTLGADVPVCLAGRPVRMQGVGEVLDPLPPLPQAWLALVNPGLRVSTPAVFKARRGPFSPSLSLPLAFDNLDALTALLAGQGNDLTSAAVSLAPAIAEALSLLAACPGCKVARMSGSGATCFGLFADPQDAANAATVLGNARPSWWAHAGQILE